MEYDFNSSTPLTIQMIKGRAIATLRYYYALSRCLPLEEDHQIQVDAVMKDLLADLKHISGESDMFENAVKMAYVHYEAEIKGEL
jgi:hypothetical protein